MKFSNLLDGLYYYTECPICQGTMNIENVEFGNICSGNSRGYNLIFHLAHDDYFTINPITEEVIIDTSETVDKNGFIQTSSMYMGETYTGIDIFCSKCHNFSYTLMLVISLTKRFIKEITLSNQKILIEEKDSFHIITSFYGREKTEYIINNMPVIELPFIAINVNNPMETLRRIKKLIVFT